MMPSRILYLCTASLLAITSGCAGFWKSRYGMDDPVYAAKYQDGAERGDVLGKVKQAIDARHVTGLDGTYYSGGTQWRDDYQSFFAGAELGTESYPASWLSSRAGVAGYVGHGDWYVGADLGLRTQLPTRLTPFAGVGMFNGFSTTRRDATRDGQDNDEDGFVDERGEKEIVPDGWLTAVYPEIGIHFWPAGQARMTAFARYWVSTEGRDEDDWMAGLQLTAFER